MRQHRLALLVFLVIALSSLSDAKKGVLNTNKNGKSRSAKTRSENGPTDVPTAGSILTCTPTIKVRLNTGIVQCAIQVKGSIGSLPANATDFSISATTGVLSVLTVSKDDPTVLSFTWKAVGATGTNVEISAHVASSGDQISQSPVKAFLVGTPTTGSLLTCDPAHNLRVGYGTSECTITVKDENGATTALPTDFGVYVTSGSVSPLSPAVGSSNVFTFTFTTAARSPVDHASIYVYLSASEDYDQVFGSPVNLNIVGTPTDSSLVSCNVTQGMKLGSVAECTINVTASHGQSTTALASDFKVTSSGSGSISPLFPPLVPSNHFTFTYTVIDDSIPSDELTIELEDNGEDLQGSPIVFEIVGRPTTQSTLVCGPSIVHLGGNSTCTIFARSEDGQLIAVYASDFKVTVSDGTISPLKPKAAHASYMNRKKTVKHSVSDTNNEAEDDTQQRIAANAFQFTVFAAEYGSSTSIDVRVSLAENGNEISQSPNVLTLLGYPTTNTTVACETNQLRYGSREMKCKLTPMGEEGYPVHTLASDFWISTTNGGSVSGLVPTQDSLAYTFTYTAPSSHVLGDSDSIRVSIEPQSSENGKEIVLAEIAVSLSGQPSALSHLSCNINGPLHRSEIVNCTITAISGDGTQTTSISSDFEISTSVGQISPLSSEDNGLTWSFQYTAPLESEETKDSIHVVANTRNVDGEVISAQPILGSPLNFVVVPAPAVLSTVVCGPTTGVRFTTGKSVCTITARSKTGELVPADPRDFVAKVKSGTISELTKVDSDETKSTLQFTFTAPSALSGDSKKPGASLPIVEIHVQLAWNSYNQEISGSPQKIFLTGTPSRQKTNLTCETTTVRPTQHTQCFLRPLDSKGRPVATSVSDFTVSTNIGQISALKSENNGFSFTYTAPPFVVGGGRSDTIMAKLSSSGQIVAITTISLLQQPSVLSVLSCPSTGVHRDEPLTCTVTSLDANGRPATSAATDFTVETGSGSVGELKSGDGGQTWTFDYNVPSEHTLTTDTLSVKVNTFNSDGSIVSSSAIAGSPLTLTIFDHPSVRSVVKCDRSILRLYRSPSFTKCRIDAFDAQGLPARALASDFVFAPNTTIGSLTPIAADPHSHSTSFTFGYRVPTDSRPSFDSIIVRLAKTDEPITRSPISLLLADVPTTSSQLTCSSSSVKAGGDLTCHIDPRNDNGPIVALMKDFVVTSKHGRVKSFVFDEDRRTLTFSYVPGTIIHNEDSLSVTLASTHQPIGGSPLSIEILPKNGK